MNPALFELSMIPDMYKDACLEQVDPLFSEAMQFLCKNAGKTSAWFHGPPGTGKTHSAVIIGKAAIAKNYGVLFTSAGELRDKILNNAIFHKETDTTWEDRANKVRVLIVDDLGSEYQAASGFAQNLIMNILIRRFAAPDRFSTILTTNLRLADLTERYTSRTTSRILGNAYEIDTDGGKDYRKDTYRSEFSKFVRK